MWGSSFLAKNLTSLAIRKKKLGTEHIHIATAYNNIGHVISKCYYDKALTKLEKGLAIFSENKLGTEHIRIAYSYIDVRKEM